MPYSLRIIWRDRGRFIPAILAVAFSAALIAVQCGMLFGIVLCSAVPIDNSRADIWLTTPDTTGVGQTRPIPESWLLRAAREPEVEWVEPCLIAFASWHRAGRGNSEVCQVVGTRVDEQSLGIMSQIPLALRMRLAEPGAVVIGERDWHVLALGSSADEPGEVNGQQVHVVGTVRCSQGINFTWMFCSLETARLLTAGFAEHPNLSSFGLVRCRQPADAAAVADRLRKQYPDMLAETKTDFSRRVQRYWLFRSKAGTIMICTVALALLVGMVVTSQTLHATVLAGLREYAMLDSLGMPRWRLAGLVMAESLWVGLAGAMLAVPICIAARWAADWVDTDVLLSFGLLVATSLLTIAMAVGSGLMALRPLRRIELAMLLR